MTFNTGLCDVSAIDPLSIANDVNHKWYARGAGLKKYELKDHLGNVRVVVSDRLTASGALPNITNDAEVLSYNHYYPFGMLQPGRNFAANTYRFGFNGKEMDNEISGSGNMYDYGFRIYDSRVARFLSVDPITRSYPMLTPYQFASNSPISGIDLDGLEYAYFQDVWYSKWNGDYPDLVVTEYDLRKGSDLATLQSMGIKIHELDKNSVYNIVRYRDINTLEEDNLCIQKFEPVEIVRKARKSIWDVLYVPYGDYSDRGFWGEWEEQEGFRKYGWKAMVGVATAPIILYSAATGVTITIGEGIISKITEAGVKSGVDILQQAIAKGGFENVDYGDAVIEGLPAAKWIKSVLKAAVTMGEDFDPHLTIDNPNKLARDVAINLVFDKVDIKGSPGTEEFVIGVGKKFTKDQLRKSYSSEQK
ncbi:MAG: RHS repeat-associated core domain-containing protein [Bacteroidales bacterium]|nr:RHS repeat-associated core domain-containing protein [Bacteroidales bacterium]